MDINEIKSRLETDGFVVVPEILSETLIAGAHAEMAGLVASHAAALRDRSGEAPELGDSPIEQALLDLHGTAIERCPLQHDALFYTEGLRQIVFAGPVRNVVQQLLGEDLVFDPMRTVRTVLPARVRRRFRWSQTAAQIGSERKDPGAELRAVCVWAPLVNALPENGALQLIRESHQAALIPHIQRGRLLAVPADHAAINEDKIVSCSAQPGAVVFFNPYVIATHPPNFTRSVLWSAEWIVHDRGAASAREAGEPDAHSVPDAETWARHAPAVSDPVDPQMTLADG